MKKLAKLGLLIGFVTGLMGCQDTVVIKDVEPPQITVNTTTLDFGTVNIGSRHTMNLSITNSGDSSLQISEFKIGSSPAMGFGVEGDGPRVIHQGVTLEVTIYFWPTELGPYDGSLRIYSDADNKEVEFIKLLGEAETFCQLCNTPPEPACLPSGALLSFMEEGECTASGECRYTATVRECVDGCESASPDGGLDEAQCVEGTPVQSTPDAGVTSSSDAGTGVPPPCPDGDQDGICDSEDNCPEDANDGQTDADGDGVGDACDVCADHDDATDADGDGVPDGCDACADHDDATDADGDGVPDGCDVCAGHDDATDADSDDVPDGCDNCPSDPNKTEPGTCGCGMVDADTCGDYCYDTMSIWSAPAVDVAVDQWRYSRQTGTSGNGDEPIVIDAHTQLQWHGCLRGLSGTDCTIGSGYASETYTVQKDACNFSNWAGYGDWRLPTIQELTSLPDYHYGNPGAPPVDDFPQFGPDFVWSVTRNLNSAGYSFGASFNSSDGLGGRTYSKPQSEHHPALCVRAGASTERCFEPDDENDVIGDPATGLMWQKGYWGNTGGSSWVYSPSQSYSSSIYPSYNVCEDESFGGYDDWRMPSITELQSLMYFESDASLSQPPIFDALDNYNVFFWSDSLVVANDYVRRWVLNYDFGQISTKDVNSDYGFVKCVRDL